MDNKLYIKGVNHHLSKGLEQPPFTATVLSALYRGMTYTFGELRIVMGEERPALAVVRFDRADQQFVEKEPNYIALATTFDGNYRAIGMVRPPTHFFPLGDNLEIVVDEAAEALMTSIQRAKPVVQPENPAQLN